MSNVKNAASYSRLVDICTGYGGMYNPGRPTLQLKAMRALLIEAQSSLQDVSQKRNALSGITNERTKVYEDLKKLVSQITGTLKASQVTEETLANARYYSRLIIGQLKQGKNRLPVPSEDNEEQPQVTRSITQLSYVAKAHNFMRLAQLIGDVPEYKTASAQLQPPALLEKAAQLKALNEAWSKAKVALTNARIHRDTLFYKGPSSLLSNANAVKSYVRVEFGARSLNAAQLSELSFTKKTVR
ncbi:MAG: hypothetical protein ABJH04_06120 [Cyclobacteriaceae bacterium]